MEGIFERLSLKEEFFKMFKVASDENIIELWKSILEIDNTLELDDKTKKSIKDKNNYYRAIPAFIKTATKKTNNNIGFSSNAQIAKNVGIVVECCECNKWRVLYTKESETSKDDNINNYESDNVSKLFEKVKVNNSLTCDSSMEIPYYSSELFEDICFQCGKIPEEGDNNQVSIEEGYYYYCNECYITVNNKKKE
ncbi:17971_t:CDS:2 [Funneliformis geosporum]|nr:17971_t:CDS:2 [Funneliformis geosporum]